MTVENIIQLLILTKSWKLALGTMWWTEIESKINSCPECIQYLANDSEPLIPKQLPAHSWKNVSMDLLKNEDKWYIVDHYLRYFEVEELQIRPSDIIRICKNVFSRMEFPL